MAESVVDQEQQSLVWEPKAEGARCNECPLQSCKFVPSDGPDEAEYVLVGEAPGIEEVHRGKPFVGKSGQLMNRVLASQGIDRDEVFVTNACLCRPPKNATPNKEAINACRERLVLETISRKPRRIIAAGAVAAKSVIDTNEGIKILRSGGLKQSNDPRITTPVVPTFHPAAALRSPDLLPTIVGDIQKATRTEVKWEPTKYKVADGLENSLALLDRQIQYAHPTIAVDVENDHVPFNGTGSRDPRHPDWLCIGISHVPGSSVVYPEEIVKHPEWQASFARYQEICDKLWTYQNGKSDVQKLWSFAPAARVDEDTMLGHYATDERVGTHDLGQIAAELLGAPDWKREEKKLNERKDGSLRGLPTEALHRYNAFDTDITHRLVDPINDEMNEQEVREVYDNLLIPGSYVLGVVELGGVKLDLDYVQYLNHDLSDRCNIYEHEFWDAAGEEVNPRSPQQLKKWLHDNGFKVKDTNKETLAPLMDKHDFFPALRRYKKYKKLSEYVAKWETIHIDGYIHANFNLQTVETGRLSSSDPNLQNVPKPDEKDPDVPNLRDAFIVEDDEIILSADYNQGEYRLAAVFYEDEWLLEQFRQDRKFHHEMARALFGDDFSNKQYTYAKNTNFGILYGETPNGLAYNLNISVKEAARIIDEWFANCPGIKRGMEDIEHQIKENGYLTSYFGRKRRFWFWTRETWKDILREGYNFPLQSALSDLMLTSLIRLTPMLEGKARPIITVHDSLSFAVKRQYLKEVARTVVEVMTDTPFSDICPFTVDLSIGERWGSEEEYLLAA